jgi:predicted Zn finger-like uncharacterized protein
MYTQCPECNTAFRITTAQLRKGQGRVKCSKCAALFDAISSLSDIAYEDHYSEFRSLPTLPLEQALPPPVADAQSEKLRTAQIPESAGRFSRNLSVTGIMLMIVLLIVQISLFEGERLVQHPELRPWFEKICGLARCALPSYRDPAAIEVLEQALEPAGPDALEFRIVMINGSRFDQAFPRIQLNLIRFNGEPLAQRVFFPEEYLSGPASRSALMPAGSPLEIRLEIVNPATIVGGYDFKLI